VPKSMVKLRHYSTMTFAPDITAGISDTLVSLPLALAIAIASGVPPQAGLYCAIVGGFLVSAVGGSAAQLYVPTGAFVVLVYDIVAKYGMDGLSMCALLVGAISVFLGFTGLGAAVKFLPYPVVLGLRNGIAVIVISTQLKHFFGIKIASFPSEFWTRIAMVIKHLRAASAAETCLSVVALTLILLFVRYVKRVPGYVVALVTCTALAVIFKLPVETIATRFGGISWGFSAFTVPHLHPDLLSSLISPAFAIAMLSAIVSLPSPIVSNYSAGTNSDLERKFVAQAIANTVSALFWGGLPVAGTRVQRDTSTSSSAKTPVAGIAQALVLLLFVLTAARLAGYIPLSVLAAILLTAACRMGGWGEIPKLLKFSKLEIGVWLTTCLLTIFADLTVAAEGGMILALLLFTRTITSTPALTIVSNRHTGKDHALR